MSEREKERKRERKMDSGLESLVVTCLLKQNKNSKFKNLAFVLGFRERFVLSFFLSFFLIFVS